MPLRRSTAHPPGGPPPPPAARPAPEQRPTLGPTRALQCAALVLLLPLLLAWPLPLVATQRVLAAPEFETASHLWGLWAALEEGQPLVLQTRLLAFPEGRSLVLVDPAHLPLLALGQALGGPALGFNLLVWAGIALCGLAGALLAIELEADPRLGALATLLATPVLCLGRDGITEDLALGWVGIQLALLLRFLRTGRPGTGVLAALSLALAFYGGPYNGLMAALIDLAIGLGLLLRRRGRALGRALLVGGGALLLVLPLAFALHARRDADQPGGAARAGLPAPDEGPERFRGGLMHGVDLLDPWVPAPLTGGVPPVPHSAYLGLVLLCAAGLAVARDRRRWPWLLGALGLLALSFGPHLVLAGRPLGRPGPPLLGPAGLLVLALPAAGRITRWYRAAGAALLLLAPLGAAAARRPGQARLLVAGLALDALLLAPQPWARPASLLPDPQPWQALDEAGALLELPLSSSGSPRPGDWRDRGPLDQVVHGRPLGGALMGLPPSDLARQGQRSIQDLLAGRGLPAAQLSRLRDAGFRFLVLRPRTFPLTERGGQRLDACLGPALFLSEELRIHRLEAAAGACGDEVGTN